MPSPWIVPTAQPVVSHDITRVDIADANSAQDVLSRLEPFLGIARRSIPVFSEVNAALTTLYTLKSNTSTQNVMPVNFSFLRREFGHFVTLG